MEYYIKASAIIIIFFVFYKIFLQNETFFQSIRFYFLVGYFFALIIPFIIIPKYIATEAFLIPKNLEQIQSNLVKQDPTLNWDQIIIFIYFIGVLFFTLRFLAQLSSLLWFMFSQHKIKQGKYHIIKIHKNIAPFSIFNYISYNENNYSKNEINQILTHEKIHANQFHSIDIIFSQIFAIVFWFNPFTWLYNREVQKNLEFIADEKAQYLSKEKKSYQYLLLKTSTPEYRLALTSNFYNSLIKNRINMLQKNRSRKLMHFKFALIIPVLITFIFTFNTKVIAQQKKLKTIEIQSDYEVEIITKDFQKNDLKSLKSRLAKNNVTFKYNKLKYNNNGEIIAIKIDVKTKSGNSGNLSQNSSKPIQPIQIRYNNTNGELSLGNVSDDYLSNSLVYNSGNKGDFRIFSSKNSGDYKKVVIEKDGGHNMIFVSGDSTKVIKQKGDGFVFISDDDNGNIEKHVIKIKKDGNTSNIWVSTDGDTTKLKNIEIIEIDEDDHGTHKMILKSVSESKDNRNVTILETDINASNNDEKVIFHTKSGKDPLFILDGKEISKEKMESISPEEIESINVLKGENAIKKYGEKGKDGVIIINTKK